MARTPTALTRLPIVLLLAILLGLAAQPAWAGDEKEGESAAEKAFIAAWWAETSSGALDQATEGYRKAVAAEGPDAVRAKALYRLAVVLERTGNTGEAIRTLERLASDFPDETGIQVQARERLEAWTAVDLRTNFDEWYRRYQYSPEFQARIVELVLTLGEPTPSSGASAAMSELLTIGAASIPALKAHLDTASINLRSRAVRLLMLLGTIPPVRHLIETDRWMMEEAAWDLFLSASPEVRADLLSQLSGDTDVEQAIRSLLAGPDHWAAALRHEMSLHLFEAMLARDDVEQPVNDYLELVSSLEGDQRKFCDSLAWQLMQRGQVEEDTILDWLAIPEIRLRAARMIAEGHARSPEALDAVIEAILAEPRQANVGDQFLLHRALLQAVADAGPDADLTEAAGAYEHFWRGRGSYTHSVGIAREEPIDAKMRLYEAVIERAKDPSFAMNVLRDWCRASEKDPVVSRRLLEWAATLKGGALAEYAGLQAGFLASDASLDEVLNAHEKLPAASAHELIKGLRSNRNLVALSWTDEQLWVLIDLLGGEFVRTNQELWSLFKGLLRPGRCDQAIRLMLEDPVRASKPELPAIMIKNGLAWSADGVCAGIEASWNRWSVEERFAAVEHLDRLWGTLQDDDSFTGFLRAKLRELAAETSENPETAARIRDFKRSLLMELPTVSVDDLRAAFDLSTPEGALAAFATKRLDHTAETYDLLAAAREVEDDEKRRSYLNAWIQHGEDDLECRAARAMVADSDAFTRKVGIKRLSGSRRAADIRVFEKALEDPSSDVRYVAAEALVGAYDKEAIKRLVIALDDPDADVRDRALRTLEIIKEIESKKEYWREFAENAR